MFNKKIKMNIKLISTTGFTFAIELSVKTYFAGYKICEVPCTWRDQLIEKAILKF